MEYANVKYCLYFEYEISKGDLRCGFIGNKTKINENEFEAKQVKWDKTEIDFKTFRENVLMFDTQAAAQVFKGYFLFRTKQEKGKDVTDRLKLEVRTI